MHNKLNAYIDPSKLQGAVLMTLKDKHQQPTECLVIPLKNSRIKRSEKSGRLGLSIDIVPNKDGKDDFGNTHWIKESTTKAERESPEPPNLPFLGNAKEYEAGGQRTARPAGGSPVISGQDTGGLSEGMEDDDIPF
jgi:hypothetical protein